MMVSRARTVLLALSVLLQVSLAQFGPDPKWLSPNGSVVDFTSTYTTGNTIVLSWTALNQSRADLWLTHWDPTTYIWHYQVAANVDISTAGTLKWYIDIPTSTIQTDNRFVLRFYPQGAAYGVLQFSQNDSPGFIVVGNGTSSSTTSTSSATASSTSSSVTTSTPSVPTKTGTGGSSQDTSSSHSSGLSVGAQAGIGVGVGLSVVLILIAGCFFGRRFGIGRKLRRSENESEREGMPMFQKNGTPYSDSSHAELEGPVTKLDKKHIHQNHQSNMPLSELTGSDYQPMEKSGAMVRPGVHELG